MDYEKKYKALLKQAKEELKTCGSLDCDAAKQIFRFFPELMESTDERTRKELLDYLKERQIIEGLTDTKVKMDWVTWLEKQGQKPVNSDNVDGERTSVFKTTQDQIDDWLKKYVDAGKQYEQKDPCKDCSNPKLNCSNFPCIEKKAFDLGKSVFECVKTEYEKYRAEPALSDADEERFVSCLKILGTGNIEQPDTANTFWLKTIKTRIQTIAKTIGEEQYIKGVRDSAEDVPKNPEDYGLLPTPSF